MSYTQYLNNYCTYQEPHVHRYHYQPRTSRSHGTFQLLLVRHNHSFSYWRIIVSITKINKKPGKPSRSYRFNFQKRIKNVSLTLKKTVGLRRFQISPPSFLSRFAKIQDFHNIKNLLARILIRARLPMSRSRRAYPEVHRRVAGLTIWCRCPLSSSSSQGSEAQPSCPRPCSGYSGL